MQELLLVLLLNMINQNHLSDITSSFVGETDTTDTELPEILLPEIIQSDLPESETLFPES